MPAIRMQSCWKRYWRLACEHLHSLGQKANKMRTWRSQTKTEQDNSAQPTDLTHDCLCFVGGCVKSLGTYSLEAIYMKIYLGCVHKSKKSYMIHDALKAVYRIHILF